MAGALRTHRMRSRMDSGTALVEERRQQEVPSRVLTTRLLTELGIRLERRAAEPGSQGEMKSPADARAQHFAPAESEQAGSTALAVRDHQDLRDAALKASADSVSVVLTAGSASAGIADLDGASVGDSDSAGAILIGVTDGAIHIPIGDLIAIGGPDTSPIRGSIPTTVSTTDTAMAITVAMRRHQTRLLRRI